MPDLAQDCLQSVRREISAAQLRLNAEISRYPTPISGCDAQFNHLLAARRKVAAAMTALDAEVHIPTPRAP